MVELDSDSMMLRTFVCDGPAGFGHWFLVNDMRKREPDGVIHISVFKGMTVVMERAREIAPGSGSPPGNGISCILREDATAASFKDMSIDHFAKRIECFGDGRPALVLDRAKVRERICCELFIRIDDVSMDILMDVVGETRKGLSSLLRLIPKRTADSEPIPELEELIKAIPEDELIKDDEPWCDRYVPLLGNLFEKGLPSSQIGPLADLFSRLRENGDDGYVWSPWGLLKDFDSKWSELGWEDSLGSLPNVLDWMLASCGGLYEQDKLYSPSTTAQWLFKVLKIFNQKLHDKS